MAKADVFLNPIPCRDITLRQQSGNLTVKEARRARKTSYNAANPLSLGVGGLGGGVGGSALGKNIGALAKNIPNFGLFSGRGR
jgi:hypothetical protein